LARRKTGKSFPQRKLPTGEEKKVGQTEMEPEQRDGGTKRFKVAATNPEKKKQEHNQEGGRG